MSKVSRENKEALNIPDSTRNILFKRTNEKILLEEGPLIVKSRDVTGDTLWGFSTWQGGYWDGTYTAGKVVSRVVNTNNTHYENFCDNTLEDTSATTGNWSTATQTLILSHAEIGQNIAFFKNNKTIINARMIVSGELDNAILYMSSDGTNFESVSNNTSHTFTNTGTTGKWKIAAAGGGVTATKVQIKYNE